MHCKKLAWLHQLRKRNCTNSYKMDSKRNVLIQCLLSITLGFLNHAAGQILFGRRNQLLACSEASYPKSMT